MKRIPIKQLNGMTGLILKKTESVYRKQEWHNERQL